MIKGVIFDADGTLLDSMHIWNDLGKRYLLSLGITPEDNLYEILFPMTLEESSIYLKNKYNINKSSAEIKKDILKIIDDFYYYEVQLKQGVIEYLKYLSKHNIQMVIATTSDRNQIEKAFERLNILKYFKSIFTCSELNTSKRESLIYLMAKEYLGFNSNEILVFEDVLYALKTAKKLGFITVGVEDEASNNNQKEIKNITDYYITDFINLRII